MSPRFELWTARGAGGIAVVAVRGPGRHREAARVLRRLDDGCFDPAACRVPRLAQLAFEGEVLDRVLVLDRPAAGVLELHLHGSEAVLAALDRIVGGLVAPPSGPAERLLCDALGEAQLGLALEQRGVDWEGFVAGLRARDPADRAGDVAAARRRSATALALCSPAKVVLCGRRNAGKSTLMNRLLFRERVLAGASPGLTRDPVRDVTELSGYPYELVDTAGEDVEGTPGVDSLDSLAIERGRAERSGALRLLVVDQSRGPGPLERSLCDRNTVVVCNKADLPAAPWRGDPAPHVRVSCLRADAAAEVRRRVGAALRELRALPPAGPVGGPAALTEGQLRQIEELG